MFSRFLIPFYMVSMVICSHEASSNLRGGKIDERRLDTDGISVMCRVTTFDTMYYNEMHNSSSTQEQTTCLPIVEDKELELEFPITLPAVVMEQYSQEIQMGTLLVLISDAAIYDGQLLLGLLPQYTVMKDTSRYRHLLHRHLQVKPQMTVAVVRISTSDSSPKNSKAQLQSTLFSSTGINFMNQYKAVSFGKLQWSLAPAGIIEVKVNSPVSSFATGAALVNAAQTQLKTSYQIADVSSLADKVLMCLPPGTGTWAASAGVNHWRAQFNNDWCTSLSGTMHELGHTMGLLHAKADGVEYADRSGYMGSGYTSSTFPRKGFNGYNSWKFGWYSDRHYAVYPLTDGNKLVKMASFVDYSLANSGEYVVVNVNDQYYLQYNTMTGFNVETEQKQNQVTVTESQSSGTNSLAGLSVGGSTFTISNYQSSGKTLTILACKTSTGANGASIMEISISMGNSMCSGTAVTDPLPTPRPVAPRAPTRTPVAPPAPTPGDVVLFSGPRRSAFLTWLATLLGQNR
jgi:Gametolysin peptidase M11